MGGSTEGPIYSTIDATSEDLHSFIYAQNMSTTPYASTSIMPFTNQTQVAAPGAEQPDEGQRVTPLGPPGAQYAQPDRCNGEEGASLWPNHITTALKGCIRIIGLFLSCYYPKRPVILWPIGLFCGVLSGNLS